MLIICMNCFGTIYISCTLWFVLFVFAYLCFWISEVHQTLSLNSAFFSLVLLSFSSPSLAFLLEMAQTKTTSKALDSLLAETSQINSFKDVEAYKEGESNEKYHIFGREHDKVLPNRKGEPVCWWPCGARRSLLFHVLHHLQKAQAPTTLHWVRAGASHRGQRGPCPATSQQLGIR